MSVLVLLEVNAVKPDELDAFFRERKERGDLDKLGPMASGPPNIRFFNIVGV